MVFLVVGLLAPTRGSNDLVNYLTAANFRSIQLVLTLAIKLPEAADGPRQEVFICRL